MKTSELTDATLDYWVAKAEGKKPVWSAEHLHWFVLFDEGAGYSPSTDPAIGQPIMERERISVECELAEWNDGEGRYEWYAGRGGRDHDGDFMECGVNGSTMLIAGMRVRVMMVFGATVPDDDSKPENAT